MCADAATEADQLRHPRSRRRSLAGQRRRAVIRTATEAITHANAATEAERTATEAIKQCSALGHRRPAASRQAPATLP